ncbi:hypothetical protein SEA_TESLA_60 [Mycobacterium phage Tesla]|uniref:Uncharacterized protein n=8 Tax=Marvinvirus TaxID=1982091 RepID=A0A482MDN7_9CAUD|nr:hypothetical protein FH33_gp060 [Mycobacterium phage MosMoris]YP_009614177.1 hypothetical protein FDI61_gp059 [Mycobacterium phage Marvin]ANM46339.1 hypothetical protein SEA_GATTACA_61 [Mycobacterium phage Gattaca]AVE00806.1 hypothetical protein SEA_TESLA_60 [Mycobacterium phage Tesla]QAX93113.1 hypothetical protein SEA_REDRAIDER77_62 [Mycobacterium phage RedRaider77]QBQ71353.1 hypothetical protein SEA_BLACKBEETLE_63 [Mycobacterium phage Blackbeetle]QFP94389.1 hypothetical protein SEA_POIS
MTMSDTVPPVQDTEQVVGVVVKRARDLIAQRGYQPLFSATKTGPLNISHALSLAVSGGPHELLGAARQAFSKNWGGPVSGLLDWETRRRRTQEEVLDLLDEVIRRLESRETNLPGRRPRGSSHHSA